MTNTEFEFYLENSFTVDEGLYEVNVVFRNGTERKLMCMHPLYNCPFFRAIVFKGHDQDYDIWSGEIQSYPLSSIYYLEISYKGSLELLPYKSLYPGDSEESSKYNYYNPLGTFETAYDNFDGYGEYGGYFHIPKMAGDNFKRWIEDIKDSRNDLQGTDDQVQ